MVGRCRNSTPDSPRKKLFPREGDLPQCTTRVQPRRGVALVAGQVPSTRARSVPIPAIGHGGTGAGSVTLLRGGVMGQVGSAGSQAGSSHAHRRRAGAGRAVGDARAGEGRAGRAEPAWPSQTPPRTHLWGGWVGGWMVKRGVGAWVRGSNT
jgi:hypothetical protein